MHFISDKAAATFGRLGKCETHLVKDHSVPLKVINQKLEALSDPTPASVQKVMLQNYRLGIITKDEDMLINKAGFKSDMADGVGNVFSRYRATGIAGTVNGEAIKALLRE